MYSTCVVQKKINNVRKIDGSRGNEKKNTCEQMRAMFNTPN